MKKLKLKLNSIYHLLLADQWMIYTKNKSDTYKCERMVIADVLNHCAETHTHYCNEVIDGTQADINLKEVNKIVNDF